MINNVEGQHYLHCHECPHDGNNITLVIIINLVLSIVFTLLDSFTFYITTVTILLLSISIKFYSTDFYFLQSMNLCIIFYTTISTHMLFSKYHYFNPCIISLITALHNYRSIYSLYLSKWLRTKNLLLTTMQSLRYTFPEVSFPSNIHLQNMSTLERMPLKVIYPSEFLKTDHNFISRKYK